MKDQLDRGSGVVDGTRSTGGRHVGGVAVQVRGVRGKVRFFDTLVPILGLLDGQLAALGQTHLAGKGRMGLPGGRSSRRLALFHHPIHLLESETLGLPDQQVGVDRADHTGASPDEEDLRAEVLGESVSTSHRAWGYGWLAWTGLTPLSVPTMYGVMTVMIQFHSLQASVWHLNIFLHCPPSSLCLTHQLEAVDRPTPRDRIGIGKISPMTTQAPGPQVDAKKKM